MKENSGNIKVRGMKGVKRWLSYIVTLSMLMSLVFIPQIDADAAITYTTIAPTASTKYYSGAYRLASGTYSNIYLSFYGDATIYVAAGDTVTLSCYDGPLNLCSTNGGCIYLIVDGTLNVKATGESSNGYGGEAAIKTSGTVRIGGSGSINVQGQDVGVGYGDQNSGGGGAGIGSWGGDGGTSSEFPASGYDFGTIYITDTVKISGRGGKSKSVADDDEEYGYLIGSGGRGAFGSYDWNSFLSQPWTDDASMDYLLANYYPHYGSGYIYKNTNATVTNTDWDIKAIQGNLSSGSNHYSYYTTGTYTMPSVSAPSRPYISSIKQDYSYNVTVSWDSATNAKEYYVYYKKSTESTYSYIRTSSTSATISLGSGAIGSTYNVYVAAANAGGQTASFTTNFKIYKNFSGSGTSDDPYLIQSEDDLQNLRVRSEFENFSGKYFKMTSDIDVYYTWSRGIRDFAGIFDGDYHEIYFSDCGSGLFDSTYNDAIIKNLGITGSITKYASWTSDIELGGIVNCASGTITNCYNTADIYGGYKAGGIVGTGGNVTISNCYNRGSISADEGVGGIVGESYGDIITNCYNTGDIDDQGSECYDEIAYAAPTTLTNCYYLGSDDNTVDGNGAKSRTETTMKSASFVTELGSGFRLDKGMINDGYPILAGMRPKNITLTWSGLSHTYDGSAKTASVTAKYSILESTDYNAITYDGSTTAPSAAGTYKVATSLTSTGSKYFSITSGASATMTISATNPGAPTDVTATRNSDGSVKVSWTNPTFDGDGKGDLTYTVYYGTSKDDLSTSASISNGGSITGLTAGTTYYFKVTATNKSGLSTDSDIVPADGLIPYVDLAYPGGKTLATGTVGAAYSASVAGATGGYGTTTYAPDLGAILPEGLNVNSDGTITGTPKTAGTYNFYVVATNGAGSVISANPYTMTIDATVPDAPTITSAERSGDGAVKVTWTAPKSDGGSAITGYVVSYTANSDTKTLSINDSTATEAIITGLTNRTSYSFTVRAVNNVSSGAESNSMSAAPYEDLKVEGKVLPTSVVGSSYLQDLSAAVSGGLGSYTYEVTGGSLPDNLYLNSSSGLLTGTTTTAGTYTFTVTVTDSSGLTASGEFTIGVVTSLAYGGGTGTEKDPYIISTREHLSTLMSMVNGGTTYSGKYFKLANDIKSSCSSVIGSSKSFAGVFDGDYHEIEISGGHGLFGNLSGTVKNLGITGSISFWDTMAVPDTSFCAYIGALANTIDGSATVENCYNKANIEVEIGRYYYDYSGVTDNYLALGGLIGRASSGSKISNCYNMGDLEVCFSYDVGQYNQKYVYGNSFSNSDVGGVSGDCDGITTNCYNTGNITAYIDNLVPEDVATYEITDFGPNITIPGGGGSFYLNISEDTYSNHCFGNIMSSMSNGIVNCYSTGPALEDTFSSSAGTVILTEDEMKTADFVSNLGDEYKRDKAFVNNGFPIHNGRRPENITAAWSGGTFTYDGNTKAMSITDAVNTSGTSVLLEEGDYNITYNGSENPPSSASVYTTELVLTEEGQRYFSFAENEPTKTSTMTINATNPDAPTDVKAERATANSVKLTWKAPEFDGDGKLATTYNIYYGTDSGNLQKYSSQLTSGQSVTGLATGQTYYFAVAAVNSSGLESSKSAPVVSALVYPDVTYTGRTLENGEVGKEYNQNIASATGGTGVFKYEVAAGSTLPGGLSLSEDGILSGVPTTVVNNFGFKVTASNDGGSATADFELTIDPSAPAAPAVEAASGEDGKVTITWTAPGFTGGKPLTKYILQRSDNGKQFVTLSEPMSVDTKYTDSNVTNGTTYYYRMFAVNSVGLQSAPSETKEAKPYRVPDALSDLTATTIDKYSIELAWSEPYNGGDDITGYTIKVYSDEAYQNEITASVTVGEAVDNKAVVSGLTKDTTYYFATAASNNAGTGAEAKASAATFTNPSEPTGLTPEIASQTAIKLTWTAPESTGGQNVVSYNVYYRIKDAEKWTKIDGIEATEYTVENLTTGTLYEFKVTAMNGTTADDEGPDSEIVEMIPAKEPAAPVIGELVSKNASAVITSIDVDNNFGNAVKKYIVYTSTDGVEFTKHTEIETNFDSSNNILIGDLVNGTEYQIKVSAMNDFGESEKSNAQTVIVGMPIPPKNVKVVPQPGQKIEITYDAADGQGSAITGYDLYIGGTNDGSEHELEKISVEGTSYVYDASDRINGDMVAVYVVSKSQPQTEVLESAASATATAFIGSPSAPEITNLTADDSGIDLTWTSSLSNGNSKKYYEVTIVDENGSDLQKFKTTSPSTLTMRITTEQFAFESGKTYGAYVTCWNTAGEGPASNIWSFRFGAPQAPEVEEPVMGDGELTVKWSEPQINGGAEIIGYNIYLNDETEPTMYVTWHNDTAPYQLYITDFRRNDGEIAYGTGQDNLDSFEVVVNGLANGFAYSVRVTAVNTNGEGPGQEIDEPITPATRPSVPRDIVASATSANDISISWNKPYSNGGSAVTGYFVAVTKTGEKNYDTGDYDNIVQESPVWSGTINSGTSVDVSDLEAGSRYEVKLSAINAAGQGEIGTATVYTHSKPSKPVITELISGVGETTTLPLTVRWNAPEDDGDSPIIGYDIYATDLLTGGTYRMSMDNLISADTTEYVINDVRLRNTREYAISVIAYNAVTGTERGEGVWSDKMNITLGTVHPPKDIKANGDLNGNLTITWPMEQYAGIEQYIDRFIIYLNDSIASTTKSNSVDLTMIPAGTQQKVQISVMNKPPEGVEPQEGLKSEPIYYTIGAPDAVTNIIAQPAENGAVVTWSEVPAVDMYKTTAYNVYVDGVVAQTINVDETTELKAVLTDLTAGKEYSVNVTAVNANGESVMGDTVKVTPYAKPDAPIVKEIKPGIGSFIFTFDEPNGNGAEITGYKVFVDGSEAQAAIAGNTVIVAGVTDGEVHEFYIIAENDKGLSSDAPAEPYEIVTGVPSAPENPEVVPGDGSAEIIFDKPEDVDPDHPTTGYEVLDNGVVMDPQPEIIETEDGKLIVKIDPLENGSEHTITIRPINDIGKGQESDPVVVVPGIPQAPEITGIVSGNGKLSIEWSEAEENAGRILYYNVYVSDAEGTDYTLASTTPITNAEIGDLTNGKPYLIRISATNYVGEGALSDPMSGTPGAASGQVGEITAVQGYADGSCSITLKWDAPADNGGLPITEYIVEGDGEITVDSANRTAVITGLDKGTAYYFTITPVNNAGKGEAKTTDAITTLSEPGAPTIKSAAGTNRRITVSWTAPENTSSEITAYAVYAQLISGGDIIRVEYNNPIADDNNRYSYVLTEEDGITVGNTYIVTVAAINIVGESSMSNDIEVMVTEDIVQTVPGAPTEFTVTPGDGSVQISWKAPVYDGNSSITKYCIWRGPSPDDIGPWAEVDGYTFSYTDTGLKNGTTYYYKVKAVNAVSVTGGSFTEATPATPTQVIPPSKPTWVEFNNETGVSAYEVNAQGNAMTIRWNESTGDEEFGAISYNVYVNGDLKTTTTDLSYVYVLENPENNIQYNIQIKAVNEKGAESSSDFIHAYRSLNVRKGSAEDGFEYPAQYSDGIYAYIDANYDGVEDNVPSYTKPSAPQNFNVTTDELNTEVILTWSEPANNGNADITKYNVYVDGTTNTLAASDIVLEDGSYKYSYPLKGRATVHSFYVTAVNEQNLEGDSTPIKYAPISYNPSLSAPTDLGYAVANKTDIVLSWTAVDGADSYVLYTNGMPKTLTVDDITIDGTTVSYTYPGEINMTYTFMVSAKSGTTESAVSASVYADTHETPAEAPLNVTLTPGESSIEVTWDAPSNIDEADVLGYIVYINGDHVYELTDASGKIEYTTSECTYTIDELKTVYVKVAAISNHGTVGAISDTQEYIYNPALDPDTPPMPIIDISGYEFFYSEIDGILLKENNLKFTWTAGNPVPGEHEADTVSYNVFVDGVQVAEEITDLEYTCTVTAGKDSLIEVQSVAENGKTGPKAPLNVEVPENNYPQPDKITDLTAELGEDNTTVTLTWTESSDTDTYYYLVVNGTQQAGTVTSGYVYTLDSSVTNYIFMLKSAKTYSDGTEVTVDSNEETVTVSVTDPEDPSSNPPKLVKYVSYNLSAVKVFWAEPEPREGETGTITEYKVVVKDTSGEILDEQQVSASGTLVYEISGTDSKVVEVYACKEVSETTMVVSSAATGTVSPKCNVIENMTDYENYNDPTVSIAVDNVDANFDGIPDPDDEIIPIPVRPVIPISGISIKLVDEYGNEIYADVEEGDSEFNAKFPADKMQGNTYSIVVSKEGYTSYTVTGISKEDLASVELNKVELYVGDLNGNGVINFEDKAILSGNLDTHSDEVTITMGDLNENGAINFEDKAILSGNMDKSNISKSLAEIK